MHSPKWQFWIDRGGTFTDVVARRPSRSCTAIATRTTSARPGPACYRNGGPLTVTDCNVLLGKIQAAHFPKVFGADGRQSLDTEAVRERFAELTQAVNAGLDGARTAEEVAEGFLAVAVGNMAEAIKKISLARGHDPAEYTLRCFGGAGGQSACQVADALGIRRIFLHRAGGRVVGLRHGRGGSVPAVRARDCSPSGRWHDTPIFTRDTLQAGQTIPGPALVIEPTATIVIEPGWQASIATRGEIVLARAVPLPSRSALGTECDPVYLEIFNKRFMAIAEEMGIALAHTAHSVNIKERLDFSCAIFNKRGELIANAPHIPVHLGSMGDSARIEDEGVWSEGLRIVAAGEFLEQDVRRWLASSAHPARQLAAHYGLPTVQAYMEHALNHGEAAVREAIGRLRGGDGAVGEGDVLEIATPGGGGYGGVE